MLLGGVLWGKSLSRGCPLILVTRSSRILYVPGATLNDHAPFLSVRVFCSPASRWPLPFESIYILTFLIPGSSPSRKPSPSRSRYLHPTIRLRGTVLLPKKMLAFVFPRVTARGLGVVVTKFAGTVSVIR